MNKNTAIKHAEKILTRWARIFGGFQSDVECSIETWQIDHPLVAEVDFHNEVGGSCYMQVDYPHGIAICGQVERWIVALMGDWCDADEIVREERRRLSWFLTPDPEVLPQEPVVPHGAEAGPSASPFGPVIAGLTNVDNSGDVFVPPMLTVVTGPVDDDLGYTDRPTHVRLFSDEIGHVGDEPLLEWNIDGADNAGRFTEMCWTFGTFSDAAAALSDFVVEATTRGVVWDWDVTRRTKIHRTI